MKTKKMVAFLVVLSYLILGGGLVLVYFVQEHNDMQQDYKRCLTGNESREEINNRFDGQDAFFKKISPPGNPQLAAYLENQKKFELQPRDCEKDPTPDPLETVLPPTPSPRASATPSGSPR